jgi:hypothetical protein
LYVSDDGNLVDFAGGDLEGKWLGLDVLGEVVVGLAVVALTVLGKADGDLEGKWLGLDELGEVVVGLAMVGPTVLGDAVVLEHESNVSIRTG